MSQSTIVIIAVVVLIALFLLFYLVRGRKQHVSLSDPARVAPAARAAAPIAAPPIVPLPAEGHGLGSEVSAAIEDVIDQFVGIDAHPSGQDQVTQSGDALTMLKGLGPRAATRLGEIGVTRFDQIAQWDDGDVAAIDAQMGAFKGRIVRDRWVEQAKLLAAGDTTAFEAEFGKLGG